MRGTSAASVSAASNGVDLPTSALQKQRYSSRSNSLSSSSVVTIKRTGSLSSSSTDPRHSAVPIRSQSPSDTLIALRLGRDPSHHMSQDHKRRKSVAVDPSSHGESEGLNNLNRWSQSTNSSAASLGRRSRASSGAALATLANQQFSPGRRSRNIIDHSPRSSPQRKPLSSRASSHRRRYSPPPSPDLTERPSQPSLFANSLTALPALNTTPALTDPNDTESPSTIQTLATPSTQSSYAQDYFGDDGVSPRTKAKDKRPVVIRNHTAPMSAVNQMRTTGPEPPREPLRRTRTVEKQQESNARPSASGDDTGRRRSRAREGREKDKKAMLSKALQKANTAVLLDNAQNFEGALEAYSDACRLLQQVMDRSSGADDKRKLEAIRVTYTNRIEELEQLESIQPPASDEKSLPTRPMSDDSIALSPRASLVSPIDRSIRDSAVIETATMTRIVDVPRLSYPRKGSDSFYARTMEAVQKESAARTDPDVRHEALSWEPEQPQLEDEPSADVTQLHPVQQTLQLAPADDSKYMPAPLSPRRPPSPKLRPEAEQAWQHEPEPQPLPDLEPARSLSDANDNASSWLDTIDESGSDCASSVHSFSQDGPRRKHIRNTSGETDPDFDAAFDAAVEAAYDEGLEPDLEARRKQETARKHVPKDSIVVPSSDIKEVLSPTNDFHPSESLSSELSDDEEERLLDEITNDYASGFSFDLSSKSALPRQSDSSGYSRSTWQSSQASADRATAATSLSTVEEDALSARFSRRLTATPPSVGTVKVEPPPIQAPPPTTALPKLPSMSGNRLSGVRGRRMSGQSNPKQLRIETSTSAKPEGRKRASTYHHSPSPMRGDDEQKAALNKDFKFGTALEPTESDTLHDHILTSPPSLDMRSAVSDTTRPQTASVVERGSLDDSPSELPRSARPNLFRKNKSSVSLREREHTVLLSSPDDSAPSVATPMSSNFMTFSHKRSQDPLTSQRAKFPSFDANTTMSLQSGGAYLFDTSLSVAQAPTSPRSPTSSTQPIGLEPCPESFLLRPFWLMRSIASTLSHPKGGFVTRRLFVPREVWHTRGVKLKAVEDKVANCDLLTAALGRLAGVDTYDADAVMDELQGFEEVMERVQAALSKKLGSDVGLHGTSGLFKDASGGGTSGTNGTQAGDAIAGAEKAQKSKEGKGYLNSWRKLRSKSSGTPLNTSQVSKSADKEQSTMPSVPMTSFVPVERRGQRKDVRNLTFEGPQKEYMGSLARLFEGVQVLGKLRRSFTIPDVSGQKSHVP